MDKKFKFLILILILLAASTAGTKAFSWDDLRIKYNYNYSSYDSVVDELRQYNLTVDSVLVYPNRISYIVSTDDPDPRSNTYHVQNFIDTTDHLFISEIYDNNSVFMVDFDFNLTLNLEELGAHYIGLFFIPVKNSHFSFKRNYVGDYNFTYDTTFEMYNRTESGFYVHLEYISSFIPTYSVKELIYSEEGELLRLYQSSTMQVNNTFSYFSYTECILESMSRTSAETKRVNAINLIVIQAGILLTVVLFQRKKQSKPESR